MSDNEKQQLIDETESETEQALPQQQQGKRTMQRIPQQQAQQQQQQMYQPEQSQAIQHVPAERRTGDMGGRTGAIRESRIKDRPVSNEGRDSSLKIKIELDLEVEVDLYARVKGDVTIGLL